MNGGSWFDIHFEIAGQKPLEARFNRMGTQLSDLSPAWEQVGEDLLEHFGQNFDQEGGVFGKTGWAQWPELAQSTVQDRLRRGYGGAHPILVREGELLDSVTRRGAPGNVFEVRPDGLTIGSSWFTAPYHQHGTRKMPARRVIGISWEMRADIRDRIQSYVMAVARGEAGL